jgi:hypothetical protein
VRYTRHKSPVKPGCNHCIEDHRRTGAQIRSATYIRTEGEKVTYLCFPHVADLRNREMLGQPDVTR